MTHQKEATGHSKEKAGVRAMFDAIAPRYDLLNHILSMGIDRRWRKTLTRRLARINPNKVIDVATGTADLALLIGRETKASVTGVDISTGMISIGQKKVNLANMASTVTLVEADSANLPFDDHAFDAATVAFGVRNFEHTVAGLREMTRVIKPGGKIFVLEFSTPKGFPGLVASVYMRYIMPWIGRVISRHPTAYNYLPETALAFPEGEQFAALLREAGLEQTTVTPLTFGVATLYDARKPMVK